MQQKNIYFILGAVGLLLVGGGFAAWKMTQNSSSGSSTQKEAKMTEANYDLAVQEDGLSKAVATMELEDGNIVTFRFYTDKAPNTARRIAQLVSEGFYDGIEFHRVIPGFVVQGGDPTGTGASGSGQNLKAEFNDVKHVPGIWSMARAQDPDSADSQFFIMTGTHSHLDGQYTVFGKVIEGMDHVYEIKQGDRIKKFTIQ